MIAVVMTGVVEAEVVADNWKPSPRWIQAACFGLTGACCFA